MSVTVFTIDLDDPPSVVTRQSRSLSEDENRRRTRYLSPRHAVRWAVGRAALRLVMGAATGVNPADLSFRTGPWGRPEIESGPSFSMTHSGPLAAIAVDFTAEIGIDLELSDRAVEFEWLVHVLSARERQQADGNVPRRDELLALWVRKEAAVKALGRGLSFPLNEVDVGLGKAAGVWRELTVEERGTMRVLNFIDLDLASDSAATLARIGSATSVRIRAISVLD